MRIYKDILEELSMNSMYLICKNQNFFCTPLDISGNVWTLAVDADFTISGNCELVINTYQGRLIFNGQIGTVETNEISVFTCIHRCILSLNMASDKEIEFIKKVREVESEQYKWNKRREERFEIKTDIADIQLASPQQKIILKDDTQPCFINNISFSGAQLLTYDGRYEIGGKLVVSYSFTNPPEEVQIPSYIRHIITQPPKENMDRLTVLCLEYDHAPRSFQKRMQAFVERLAEKKIREEKKQ